MLSNNFVRGLRNTTGQHMDSSTRVRYPNPDKKAPKTPSFATSPIFSKAGVVIPQSRPPNVGGMSGGRKASNIAGTEKTI
ncbi:hypothetical protein VTL71DRAFT_9961, partial [Oculimacula yallundae]